MVYYYGGAYILGTGQMYPGYRMATQGNIIVVNFNYRVSTLGWLASGE
jgi:carboxylesterase type B